MTFTDNWTGAHPGGGYLLVVDAHDRPLNRPPNNLKDDETTNYAGLVWDTRVQSYDAAFGLDQVNDITLTRYENTRTYKGLPAVPNFKDNHEYWNQRTPSASVITPEYGLLFRILGQADDKSAIEIAFGNRNALDQEEYLSVTADFFYYFEKLFIPLLDK